MANALTELSNQLAAAVERARDSVVTVHGRPRISSSGVVWRPGLVVTADAALRRDEEIRITLPDGATVPATLKGRDAGTDLALLAYEAPGGTPAQFSPGTPRAGQIVLTVGRTADTGPIATMGVISGVSGEWRTWRGGALDQFVRLDVSVYPTSAGGAVVDSEGAILGMVAAGLSRSSVIAVTHSTINRVAEALSTKGHMPRGYLGIGLQTVAIPEALRRHLEIKQDSGVMLLHVEDEGPAARSGLLMGDVLLSLAGRNTESAEDLQDVLGPDSADKTMIAHVLRGGGRLEVQVTVGQRPQRGA